jgi:tetratricopeptide (TPR) repeat protein
MEDSMKRNVFLGFVFCLTLSFATSGNLESQEIKTIFDGSMVAPSKNEQAMSAYSKGTQLLEESKKLEEAEKYFKMAIDLDPFFVDTMDHLGMVFMNENDVALEYLEIAREGDHSNEINEIIEDTINKIRGKK